MIGNEGSWTRLSLDGKDDFLDCMIRPQENQMDTR
jgi:hypothetical protein